MNFKYNVNDSNEKLYKQACLVYNKNTESCKSKIQKVAGGNSIVLQKTIAGITQNLYP